jgi:predicted nucleotidyltransferase
MLYMRPDESFHLRQIVRLTGGGIGPVHREVGKLSRAGLVLAQRRGRQVFYSAHAGSPCYEELKGLVLKTVGLADVLRQALEPLRDRITIALLYGSFARGQQQRTSDVDVLVIAGGSVTYAELAQTLQAAQRQMGREINPMLYRPAEFKRKLLAGHHFLTGVARGPKLFLIGDEHDLERLGAQRLAATTRAGAVGDRGPL